MVKNLPALQETCVRSLGQEDPLEKEWLPIPVFWPGEFYSCVGPGKSNLPFELRRKAGDCSRVTAGPIDLI